MHKSLSINKRLLVAFGVLGVLLIFSVFLNSWKAQTKDKVFNSIAFQQLPNALAYSTLRNGLRNSLASLEGFLLLGDDSLHKSMKDSWNKEIYPSLKQIERSTQGADLDTLDLKKRLIELEAVEEKVSMMNQSSNISGLIARVSPEALSLLQQQIIPKINDLQTRLSEMETSEFNRIQEDLTKAQIRTEETNDFMWQMLSLELIVVLGLGVYFTKSIARFFSAEVKKLRESSQQLKATSAEQLNDVTEQTAATGELSATMNEFLSIANTVVERCQQVTGCADSAVHRCVEGQNAVGEAQNVVTEIKGEIERIVKLMTELGQKTQQINMAVEIISELSEQTTILSYNAAIEAAAAGEAGQSFAVVADHVGKLADRAKEASRDVRSLIDSVQGSANTTIMATEGALKAADQGLAVQQEASEKMSSVVNEISQTLEAAKEIQMASTQQCTAAGQVTEGIDNILTAARESQYRSEKLLTTAENLAETALTLENI